MIVTVTLNPAFDHILYLPELFLGRIARAVSTQRIPGGKGINVACALAVLGEEEVVATGFLGGRSSQPFEEPLRKLGVTTSFIYTDQELRTDFYVIEEKKNRQTLIIEEGDSVKLRYLNSFKANFERLLSSTQLVEIGGSLPKGVSPTFIKELIEDAAGKKIKVVLNLREAILKECLAGDAKLFIVKPDLREDKRLFGKDLKNSEERRKVAQEILNQGAEVVILNFGPLSYLAAKEKEIWEGEIEGGDYNIMIGVEDGMLAGFIHDYLSKENIMEGLKYGLAAALSTARNKMNYPNSKKEVEEFLSQVKLRKVA